MLCGCCVFYYFIFIFILPSIPTSAGKTSRNQLMKNKRPMGYLETLMLNYLSMSVTALSLFSSILPDLLGLEPITFVDFITVKHRPIDINRLLEIHELDTSRPKQKEVFRIQVSVQISLFISPDQG